MNRRRFALTIVLVAFVLVLITASPIPNHITTQSFDSPTVSTGESMVLSDDSWNVRYEEHGTTVNNHNGSYTYSARIGETNIWNGTAYTPYIWNESLREIYYFQNHTVEFYDWFIRVTNATHTLVDDARWQVHYWSELGGGRWNFLDLYSHSWLEPVFNEESMTFGQHYEDGTGNWLDIEYMISNWDIMKVTAKLHVVETNQYQLTWQLTGIQGEPEVRKDDANFTEGISFGKVAVGWWDVVQNNGLNATFSWEVSNKKLDVQFSNFTVNADETYILDPSISDEEIGADSDDTNYEDGGNQAGRTYNYVAEYYDFDRWHGMRWSLAIPEDSTFSTAFIEIYQQYEEGTTNNWVNRMTEDNPASLEADSTAPSWTATARADIDLNTNGGWETSASMVTMMNTHIAQATWESGDYMGFIIDEPDGSSDGDTVRDVQSGTGAEITLTWTEPNSAPTNDGTPTILTLDDTDNLYSRYRRYEVTTYHNDANGYADIDFVQFYMYSNTRGTLYWYGKFDEGAQEFTEAGGTGTYWELDTVASSYSASANDLDLTWKFWIEWTHPDVVDCDIRAYVIDESATSDDDYYELNWDIETDLTYDTTPTITADDAGTVDRGDLDETFHITGNVGYEGSTLTPPSSDVDVWVDMTVGGYGTSVGPWEDDTLGASGDFQVDCGADNAVGTETYTIKVVDEGAGYSGTDLVIGTDPTDAYIADTVQVQYFTAAAPRTNIDSIRVISFYLRYDYNNAFVTDGTVTLEGETAQYMGDGKWQIQDQHFTVIQMVYDTVVCSGGAHGLTGVDMNGQSQTMIWDRVQVQSYSVSDSRQSVYDNVNIEFFTADSTRFLQMCGKDHMKVVLNSEIIKELNITRNNSKGK